MPTTVSRRRAPATRRPPVLAVAALTTVAGVLLTGLAGSAAVAVDDLTQLTAAVGAALACARAAAAATGRRRQAWTALAVGCGGWSLGQAVWSWYRLVLGVETPFPSPADLGFLVFPVAAAAGLLLHPAASTPLRRRRRLLDGALVIASVALLSWVTALGAVLGRHTDLVGTAVSVAYPAGDAVVLALVVLLLSTATADRRALTLVGAGTGTIAASDSAFLYLTSLDLYDTDLHLLGLGWACGFVLIGLGALAASPGPRAVPAPSRPGRPARLLPYAPVVLALGIQVISALSSRPFGRVETVLSALVILLVLLRQAALVHEHAGLLDELAAREAELRHAAFHDGLTGLVNRALFRDRLDHALAQRGRSGQALAVLFCDLDDFKLVNDTLGHATGDALLVEVAGRLRGALRSGDTLARLGGDEFAVLLEDGEDASAVADVLVGALTPAVVVGGREVVVRMSVGVTTVTVDAVPFPTVDDVLAQADTAMYAAKRNGGGVRAYTPGMALAEVAEADVAGALAAAVADRQVSLVYQPIVDLRTGEVEGVEALARWSHDGSSVPPADFVALAERTGLIASLTDLVLDTACAQVAAWRRPDLQPTLRVGVNLSPSSITDPSLPEQVARCLRRHGLTGSALVLEITETGVLHDPTVARRVCARLREQGVLLALDDFGVGFASLGHLNELPLDLVKLDRSLLAGVGSDADCTRFVSAVLRLGTELGLDVVAEGVEEPEQLAALRAMGMPFVQGFLLSRPLPAEQVTPLLGPLLLERAAIPRGV